MTTDNTTNSAKLPPIEGMIIKAIEQNLTELFNVRSQAVVFCATTDRMRIAQRMASEMQGADANVLYPLLFLSIGTVSQSGTDPMHSYNAKSLSRRGQYLKLNSNEKKLTTVSLVPAIFEFEVLYVVDDFAKAFAFTTKWITAGQNNRMNFTLTYGSVSADIRCILSDSVSTPPREESVDQPNAFEYSATIRVAGYITDPDSIHNTSVVRGSQLNVIAENADINTGTSNEYALSRTGQRKVWGNT